MSSIISVSVKKSINKQKLDRFNKKLTPLKKEIAKYKFLEEFVPKVDELKENYKNELNNIKSKYDDWYMDEANQLEVKYSNKLLELKTEVFSKRDFYLEVCSKYEIKSQDKYIEISSKNENLEIMLNLLKQQNEKEYQRIKNLNTNLDLQLLEAKIIYQKLLNTKLIKDEIKELNDEKLNHFLSQTIIEKEEYQKELKKHYFSQKILPTLKENLKNLGYTFEESGDILYFNTDEEEYKVGVRLSGENINFVFTKFGEKGSEYEQQRDKEKAKKWCGDFDKLKKEMSKNGIELDEVVRIEPDEKIKYERVKNETILLHKQREVKNFK